ncbi:GumC family protein [Pelagibacterium xiamenense]|uniref:GumC family protein n=1 Tax=Pelagibacterium xiamenense TaxID=2901140 RepID=UPI001E51E427|nr:Wzz/FepE/Etk N-terminal domain-containing protein [Pelagibacterium xiamenense]MCD7059668.1 Wzz/FepE/Etk N-terminal domain-containing protein [Pelagibacterium xiamenense]
MNETEIDLRALFGLLRRRLRLIIIVFLLVVGFAAIVTFALTPQYSSSALILVDPSQKNLLNPELSPSSASRDNARVDSEAEILRSDAILLDVVSEHDLVADPEFGVSLGLRERIMAFLRIASPELPTGEAALRNVLNKLRNAVSVQRRGLTYLISVEVESEVPSRSAELANAIADAYIRDQVRAKIDNVLASQEILEARVAEARAAIVASEESFDTFLNANIDGLASDVDSDIAAMRSELERITGEREVTQSLARSVEQSLAEQDWETVVATLESDAVAELERQRQQLAASLAATEDSFPAAVDLREELAAIEGQLEEAARTEVASLRASVSDLDSSASSLRQQIRSDVLASDLPVEVLTRIYELQQSAELARSQYATLLERSSDLRVQADLQIADSRIVSRALPADRPSFPNTPLLLMLAGVTGLGFGVGLAFIYENFIGGFTSEAQISSVLRLPAIQEVPRQKAVANGANSAVADTIIAAPLSFYSESIRKIRASVDQALRRRPGAMPRDEGNPGKGRVVMVSSSVPAEGKTTIALSLARTYAYSGLKTIIIDCDLRKPSVHRQLGIEPTAGLLEFLTGEASGEALANVIARDVETGLSVLTGSRRSDVPTDQLLTGVTFERLITAAIKNFDIVILDTPPIGPVVDGLYVAQYADVIAFVVRWASTPQTEARRAITRLMDAKADHAEIIAVLNQQEGTRGGYKNPYASYYDEG